jgi:hypothetical protein
MTSTTTTDSHGWRRVFAATVLTVALPAAMVFTGAVPASANAPGDPGTSSAPVSLFTEDFENGGTDQLVSLNNYTGAAPLDETYTADPAWLSFASCNGLVLSAQGPVAQPPGTNCGGGFWPLVLDFGAALGSWEGNDPSTNHVLVGYTAGDPGPGVELQTVTPIPLPSANRFLTIRTDAAGQNCGSTHPLYMFSVLDGATALPAFSSPIDPCAEGQAVIDNSEVGTYTGDQAVLFGGTAAGIELVNEQGSGSGNDGALDNIQLLDATPQLDLSATAGAVPVGASANLTFTLTNTTDLDAKDGWSFTAGLPTGLTTADNAYTTTCASATAAPGSAKGTIDVAGDLGAGQSSCTVTVHVTSIYGGTYQLCAAQITDAVGVDLPGCTTLTFTAPVFDARANSAVLTSLLLNLGPLAPSAYECVSTPGATSNGVLNTSLGALGNLGALNTSASGSIAANGTRTAASSSRTANISLLGGLISANEVVTAAQAQQPLTTSGPGQVTVNGSTTFTNLRVAGVAIAANPGPNTTVGLLGVGSLVLNEQTSVAGGDGVTVTALDLTLLTGVHLTISQSTAALLSSTAGCPVS